MLSSRHAPLLGCALLMAVLACAAWPFTVDDAFISARYALRIAAGQGYTFSGARATDGVTGPLWLLPLLCASWLGSSGIAAAKLISGLAHAGAIAAAAARARGASRGRWMSWQVVLVSASGLPAVWAVAGLETGLATAIATWLALAVSARRARGVQAGTAAAVLAWLRPELMAFAAVLLAWLVVRARRGAWWGVVIALVGVLALIAFRCTWFGHALPMTAYAKPAELANGVRYLASALTSGRGVWLALSLALAACQRDARARVLALSILAHGVAVLLVGGDWMPARRLFVPVVPTLALAIAYGLRRPSLYRTRSWAFAWGGAWVALLALSAREWMVELPALREAGSLRERATPKLRELCALRGPVALIDVGYLGWSCPALQVIDLGGLTEPAIAYARGGHLDKRIDEEWLRAQRPAALVLHSRERPRIDEQRRLRWFAGYPVERRVLGFAFVREYRVRTVIDYAPAYFYVVLEPAADAQ